MNPRGIVASLSGVFVVAILGVVIGIIALTRKPLITTSEIQDKTVQTSDLANILQDLGFQLHNGQVLKGSIFTENIPTSSVLGLSSSKGEVLVNVNENGELAFDSTDVVVNANNIANGSIELIDLGFNVISSINGVVNNGGNIDLVDRGNISITSNDGSNVVELEVDDGAGSGLDGDLLDGESSEFYRNASNINGGILGTAFYSAYTDLSTEGFLNFNEDADIVLKSQADNEYVNVAGDTMAGDLTVNADVYANNFFGEFFGCLTTSGLSTYCNDANIAGTLEVNGITWLNGNLDVDGNAEFDSSVRVRNDLRVDDRLDVYGNVFAWDNLTVDEDLFVNDDLDVDGSVDIGNDLTVSDFLTVNGNAFFDDNVTIENNLLVEDNVTIQNNLTVQDNVTIQNNLTVNDNFIVNDSATLGSSSADLLTVNARIVGSLVPNVTNTYDLGTAALRWRDVYLSGDAYVGSDLEVADDVRIGDTLEVTGDVNFDSDLYVGSDLEITDDVRVGGDLTVTGDSTFTGLITASNIQVNAQLTVNDLTVTGDAQFNGTAVFDTDLIPFGAGYNIGSLSSGERWNDLFITDIDATGNIVIGGDLSLPGYADVETELDSLNSNITSILGEIGTINSGITVINAELLSLDSRLDDLELGDIVIGGVNTTCNGSYNLLGSDCTFAVALPVGKTLKSISISPMGSGNPDVRVTIESLNSNGTVGLRIAGQIGGTNVTGLSWIASLN